MRRRAQGLIAGLAVAMAAAGCGGGGRSADTTAVRDAAPAVAPASAPGAAADDAMPASAMRPAGQRTAREVRALTERFIDALAARNSVAICRLMSAQARRAFERRVQHSCEHGWLFAFQRTDVAGRIGGAHVIRVRARGSRAIADLRNGDDVLAGEDGVDVERVGGRWWLAW